jgi:hypothetical protein
MDTLGSHLINSFNALSRYPQELGGIPSIIQSPIQPQRNNSSHQYYIIARLFSVASNLLVCELHTRQRLEAAMVPYALQTTIDRWRWRCGGHLQNELATTLQQWSLSNLSHIKHKFPSISKCRISRVMPSGRLTRRLVSIVPVINIAFRQLMAYLSKYRG